jgi:nicotinamide riboside kinase
MSICIAIVGAESTGKTNLATQLAQHVAAHTPLRVACVPEVLRGWCDRVGRTPLAHEQAAIARAQQTLIEEAAATHDVAVCDTTALMTAVYSQFIFKDLSLHARAIELQQRMAMTLLMANDLPWVADGLQRDGPQVREPVFTLLHDLLTRNLLTFEVIGGAGELRLQNAWRVVVPLLPTSGGGTRGGLFSQRKGSRWTCACCN